MHLGCGDDEESPGFDRVGSEIADVFRSHDLVSGGNGSHTDFAVRGDPFENVRDDPRRAQARDANAFRPEIGRQCLGHPHDRVLGRDIGKAIEAITQQPDAEAVLTT